MNAAGLKLCAEFPRAIPSFVEAIDSPESGVRIWVAHLDSILPNDMVRLRESLDSGERVRATKFHFERDRQRFIAVRGILRLLLGSALDIPASKLVFEYGRHGKPAISITNGDEQTLRFNISHATGSAMFALAWDREVGIDLEATEHVTRDGEKLSDLAMRVLSPREITIWRALPDDAIRATAFLRAWTRKEAYVKAIAEGLHCGLQSIEVALDAIHPHPSLMISGSSGAEKLRSGWIVHDLPAPAGFAAAVAIET